jgi:putative two-component system response regulator
MGARILGGSQSDIVRASEMVALTHHEKVDGSGYPLGRRGDDIPMLGRIVALADAFDAITSKRCYKEAESLDTGLDIARRESGIHFDPDCVAALENGFADVRAIHWQFGGVE